MWLPVASPMCQEPESHSILKTVENSTDWKTNSSWVPERGEYAEQTGGQRQIRGGMAFQTRDSEVETTVQTGNQHWGWEPWALTDRLLRLHGDDSESHTLQGDPATGGKGRGDTIFTCRSSRRFPPAHLREKHPSASGGVAGGWGENHLEICQSALFLTSSSLRTN